MKLTDWFLVYLTTLYQLPSNGRTVCEWRIGKHVVRGGFIITTSVSTHFHLVQRSRIRGAIPPLPNTPSWHGAQLKHKDIFT